MDDIQKLEEHFQRQILIRLSPILPLEVIVGVTDDIGTYEKDDGSCYGDWGYDVIKGMGASEDDNDYFKDVLPPAQNPYFGAKKKFWGFWKKRCKTEFPLDDVNKHGGSWKRTYLESYMARMLESYDVGMVTCEEVAKETKNVIKSKINTNNVKSEPETKRKCSNIYKLHKRTYNEEKVKNKYKRLSKEKNEQGVVCCCESRLLHVVNIVSPYIKSLYITQLKIERKNKNEKKKIDDLKSLNEASNLKLKSNKISAGNRSSNNSANSQAPLVDNLMLAKQSSLCMKMMAEEEEDENDGKDHVDLGKVNLTDK